MELSRAMIKFNIRMRLKMVKTINTISPMVCLILLVSIVKVKLPREASRILMSDAPKSLNYGCPKKMLSKKRVNPSKLIMNKKKICTSLANILAIIMMRGPKAATTLRLTMIIIIVAST